MCLKTAVCLKKDHPTACPNTYKQHKHPQTAVQTPKKDQTITTITPSIKHKQTAVQTPKQHLERSSVYVLS